MAEAKPKTAEKTADHPQVQEILDMLPAAEELGADAVVAAMPTDKEQLESDGNKEYQRRVGSLPLEDKIKEAAEIVKNNLGGANHPDVQKRVEAEQKKMRESTDRPGSDLDIDLPWGWTVSHAQEASSKEYGSNVIKTTEGLYVAEKRVGTQLVEQSGETPEQLSERIWAWERVQANGSVLGA